MFLELTRVDVTDFLNLRGGAEVVILAPRRCKSYEIGRISRGINGALSLPIYIYSVCGNSNTLEYKSLQKQLILIVILCERKKFIISTAKNDIFAFVFEQTKYLSR